MGEDGGRQMAISVPPWEVPKKLGANCWGRCKLQNVTRSTSNEARNRHGFGDVA
jgi:hypothetical protein